MFPPDVFTAGKYFCFQYTLAVGFVVSLISFNSLPFELCCYVWTASSSVY